MQSETIQKLAEALIKAQAEFEHVVKDKKAQAGSFSYTYADLGSTIEATQEALAKHGLTVVQAPQFKDGQQTLETRLLHTSGEWISATWLLPSNATPQQMGSALTYGRRYTMTALLGIAAEDDDGQAAEKAARKPRKPAQTKTPPAGGNGQKRQISLIRAQDGSLMDFPATSKGAIATFQALDVLLEESEDNWPANREVIMRLLTTVPDLSIGTMTVKEKVNELVTLHEGIVP